MGSRSESHTFWGFPTTSSCRAKVTLVPWKLFDLHRSKMGDETLLTFDCINSISSTAFRIHVLNWLLYVPSFQVLSSMAILITRSSLLYLLLPLPRHFTLSSVSEPNTQLTDFSRFSVLGKLILKCMNQWFTSLLEPKNHTNYFHASLDAQSLSFCNNTSRAMWHMFAKAQC